MSAAAVLCTLATGCGAASDKDADTLKIGAYSVVKEAFHDGLLPAFAEAVRDGSHDPFWKLSDAEALSRAAAATSTDGGSFSARRRASFKVTVGTALSGTVAAAGWAESTAPTIRVIWMNLRFTYPRPGVPRLRDRAASW